jgi:predicted S18 family serine protease
MRDENGDRVRDLLRTSFERQDQAEASFREQHYRVALRMTNVARELAQKSLDMTRGEAGKGQGAVEETLRRTDEVLGRVSSDLNGLPPLLEEAFNLQDRAKTHVKEGRLGLAMKLTQTARDLANRALRESIEGDGSGAVEREIESTRRLLDGAQNLAREAGSDEALDLVRQGYSHVEEAQAYLENEELMAARAQLKLARRKAERAMEVAGG